MTAIETLGVDHLSLRGTGLNYHRFSRFFATQAEAQAALDSGDWTPAIGVHNACLTGEGIMLHHPDTNTLTSIDAATRTYVDTQIADLVTNAPEILGELNQIAGQLADDADYVTEINNKIDADITTERDRASAEEAELATDILNLTTEVNSIKDGFDFTGMITAPAVGNIIPFYYNGQDQFPDATTYHGAIAHSHEDAAMYFAHGGAWHKLIKEGDSASVLTDLDTTYVSLTNLKSIVADSSDFADFQTRIANL